MSGADRRDCFRVDVNVHGEKATYARHSFRVGEILYVVQGDPRATRTRDSIEVGPGQHVEDEYALFINHSFTPNLRVRGRELVAIAEIQEGDEITFNYLESESEIAAPFTCHETGQAVHSEHCRDTE